VARLDLLLSRIDEVLATKFEGSARGWCKAADLSPSYIGALRNRGGAKGTGEVTGVKYDEVAALARAAGVKVTWLMGDDTLPSAEDAGNLERALMTFDWPADLTAANAAEIQRRARAEAKATKDDLPVKFWMGRLARIASDVRETAISSGERQKRAR
jgi:hypothetical protein